MMESGETQLTAVRFSGGTTAAISDVCCIGSSDLCDERNYTAQEQRMTSSLQKDLFLVEMDQYIQEHLPTVSTRDMFDAG